MKFFSNKMTFVLLLVCLTVPSMLVADDYMLEISRIVMQSSPMTGELWAGCSAYQAAEKENCDSAIGVATLRNEMLVLPVNIEIGGLRSGEVVAMFISLDESKAKAGKDTAEFKFDLSFKVFPTKNKEKIYVHTHEGWSFKIHYRLTKY